MNKSKLKVGQWWNNLDADQQEVFKYLYFVGKHDVSPIRKFLSAAKKRFDNPVYGGRRNFVVEAEGGVWAYSGDTDRFIPVHQS